MVQGINKLEQRLVEVIPRKTRDALEKALIDGADRVVAAAQLRVPVDTGHLKETIRRGPVKEGKKGGLYVAVVAGDKTPSGYNSARVVEFGTVNKGPQPFLLPAFRLNRRYIRAQMTKAMAKTMVW